MSNTHVLIFAVVYPPDNVSTAHQVRYVAADLAAAGNRVTVVTTVPHSRPEEGTTAAPEDPGVRVLRRWVPRKTSSSARNALSWLIFLIRAAVTGLFRVRDVDIVLAVSPPPGIGRVGSIVAGRHRAALVYNVKELYPEVAQALGVLDQPLLMRLIRRVENTSFRKADAVTAVTPGIASAISARVPGADVRVIPDSVDLVPGEVDGSGFASEFGIDGDLVITYAGNMGVPQNLDLLLDAAALLADLPGVRFVLVGDGTERERLVRRVEDESLDNVRVVPSQPFGRVPEIHAVSDLMYVPLAGALSYEAMPSKAYQALGAARPILAATSSGSALATLVAESRAGFVVTDLDGESLAATIRTIHERADQLEPMGRTGRDWMESRYARSVISGRYEELLGSLPG